MIVLLDSSVLIDVLRRRPVRVALLEELLQQGHTLVTAAINVAEVYAGMRSHESQRTEALFASLEIYEMTVPIAKAAGLMVNRAARKGRTLTLAHMIVAATAIEYGFTVATDNRNHFENTGAPLLPMQ